MQALAAVLLELDLFDPDRFLDHLIPLLSSEEAVQQRPVDRDGLPLLSDLESGLKIQKMKAGKFRAASKYECLPMMLRQRTASHRQRRD